MLNELIELLPLVIPDLLQGTVITVQIGGSALMLGLVIGLPVSLVRVYGGPRIQKAVAAYLTLFRGTPLLVQLFIVYYGLPDIGITFSRFTAAVVTLGLNSGAYQAEYFRGAIQAISQGQMTAAQAIGMHRLSAIRYIILPQAFRLVIPAWSNEVISMVKYTAIVFLIAVPDLMGKAKILSSRYFDPISIYSIVAVFYLVMVGITALLLRILSQRTKIPGLSIDTRLR